MGKPAEIKTKQNTASVEEFISNLDTETKRDDSRQLVKMMKQATKEEPMMWGASLVGFGKLRYKSPASGREVDWFRIGFSPRKNNFSLHLVLDIKKQEALLEQLGKHKTGMGCLYINKLADVNLVVLQELINLATRPK
jgi:hypothetical protein